jgi:hypothetical protein
MKGKTSWRIHSRGKDSTKMHDKKRVWKGFRWLTMGANDGKLVNSAMNIYVPKKTGNWLDKLRYYQPIKRGFDPLTK